jgi:hypothetical protein
MKNRISYLVRHILLAQLSQVGTYLYYTTFNFTYRVPADRVIPDWSHDP